MNEKLQATAHLSRRLAAFAVDYGVVLCYIAVLVAASSALGQHVAPAIARLFADPLRAQLLGFLVLTLPVVLYFALSEASAKQATLGKRVLGLRVVASEGGRMPPMRSLLRSALKFAPWELAHACLWRIPGWPGDVATIPTAVVAGFVAVWLLIGLYLATALLRRDRRTPYDRLAGSLVVRVPGLSSASQE